MVVNNDGGGIFSTLEPARSRPASSGCSAPRRGHGSASLAAAAGLEFRRLGRAAELPGALHGKGLQVIEVRTDRAAGARLRQRLAAATAAAG